MLSYQTQWKFSNFPHFSIWKNRHQHQAVASFLFSIKLTRAAEGVRFFWGSEKTKNHVFLRRRRENFGENHLYLGPKYLEIYVQNKTPLRFRRKISGPEKWSPPPLRVWLQKLWAFYARGGGDCKALIAVQFPKNLNQATRFSIISRIAWPD